MQSNRFKLGGADQTVVSVPSTGDSTRVMAMAMSAAYGEIEMERVSALVEAGAQSAAEAFLTFLQSGAPALKRVRASSPHVRLRE